MNPFVNPEGDSMGEPGFPYAPIDWSKHQAEDMARNENLELSKDHFELIRSLQEFFGRHEKSHVQMRELHDALDEKFHHKGGIKYLYTLFPGGPVAQGCRLGGLSVPVSAVNMSFGSVQ